VELMDYLRIARKHWRSIVAVVLLTVLGAGMYSMLSKPTYTATTSIFVSVASVNTAGDLNSGSTYAENQVKSFAVVATAPIVLQPVIDSLGLRTTPDELAKKVTATVPVNTATIDVEVVDGNAAEAARIANALGEQLVTTVKQLAPPSSSGAPTVAATIISPAVTPLSPTTPRTTQNVALGLALGLLLGAGQAVLRDVLNTRVRTTQDIERVTDRAVIGSIMLDLSRKKGPLAVVAVQHSPRAESYKRLRTNLQFLGLEKDHRAIVVTSTVPGEGKTTTAINVAFAMATAGERVLLIDADLRRPRIANHFGLEGEAGLTTILIGQASLDDVVQTHGVSGLDVLASGPIPPNPSELLGFPEMKDLLHEATSRYDVVILDTPPLLPVTDAAILAHIASGALIVVGSRIVRRPELGSALESLDHVDTRVLGLVLNKVQKEDEDRYGYGYEYTYDKIQDSEPVRAKTATPVSPVAPAPARGIASSR
jgi:succinoglycan biosynthesis transport protein ExoP